MKPAQDLVRDSNKYQEFLLSNLKDPTLLKQFNENTLYRARRTAIVLGIAMIFSLGATVFAFVEDVRFREAQMKVSNLKTNLEVCIQEAQKQQGLAAENMLILSEANKMAEEQLKACQSIK